jgi:hypothetical protein
MSHRVAVLALALLACAGGSSPVKVVGGEESLKTLLPWHEQTVNVVEVTQQWDFIRATLQSGDLSLDVYTPADEACGVILQKGKHATYQGTGRWGVLVGTTGSCHVAGTAELAEYRDRAYTRDEAASLEPAPSFFKTAHQNGGIWVRGQFPYARLLGFPPGDSVLVLPASDECKKVIDGGSALMLFHDMGQNVYTLEAHGARCAATGILDPNVTE